MKNMPWQGWLLIAGMLFGCGFWTWSTPTNPDELVARHIQIINLIQNYGMYMVAGLAVLTFMAFKPFRSR